MAAQIPLKDPDDNERALAAVRADKEREASDGHDGTWVAHPALVPIAREAFEREGVTTNQLERMRDDVAVTPDELLDFGPRGPVTETGVRTNLSVAIRYLAAWLDGNGAAAIDNLMEDAATAEISRSQIWQWLHHGRVTDDDVRRLTDEEAARLGDDYTAARELFGQVATQPEYVEFLTLPAYERLP